MKIAHFAQFAPHACGQYETVRDLIKAERLVGLESELIDYGRKGMECHVGKKDGHITTIHPDYVKQADVLFRHSDIPKSIKKQGKPIVLCLHGRPESTFKIGFNNGSDLIKAVLDCERDEQYKVTITFWKEFEFIWNRIIPNGKVKFIPCPVDLERYNPIGEKRKFKSEGIPNIMIADLWREDITPFNVIFSAVKFKEYYCLEAKIHIYGIPSAKNRLFLQNLYDKDYFGDFYPTIAGLEKMYRSADIFVSPHTIAVRTIREALASGLPVIAGIGNSYTRFTWNPNDINGFACEINRAWMNVQKNKELFSKISRETAEKEFSLVNTGNAIKNLLGEVLK